MDSPLRFLSGNVSEFLGVHTWRLQCIWFPFCDCAGFSEGRPIDTSQEGATLESEGMLGLACLGGIGIPRNLAPLQPSEPGFHLGLVRV